MAASSRFGRRVAPRMCGWQRVSEQLAENRGPNSSLLITSPRRLQSPQLGLSRSTADFLGVWSADLPLGLLPPLPVTQAQRSEAEDQPHEESSQSPVESVLG